MKSKQVITNAMGCLLAFLVFAAALPSSCRAQAPADSIEIERLAKLGELWSTIQYFHPYLAYRPIDWDSALVATIPRVRAATDSASYAEAVQLMLDVLDDPTTRLVEAAPPHMPSSDAPGPLSHWTADSILVITLNPKTLENDFWQAARRLADQGELQPDLMKAHGLLFDLRSDQPFQLVELDFFVQWTGLDVALAPLPLTAPGHRLRMHSGYKPQQGSTSGGYYSGFYTVDGQHIVPGGPGVNVPMVFLINAKAGVPSLALALQQASRAAIVSEGMVTDAALVEMHKVAMGDGVAAQIRLGELVYPDGTTGFVPDDTVPPSATAGDEDPALRRSMDLLRHFEVRRVQRPLLPALAAPAPDRTYAGTPYPSLEQRILAAFRIWSTIHYFFPYRELMEEDWDEVLHAYLPRLMAAKDTLAYHLAVAEMYSHIHDSHGFIQSRVLSAYFGDAPAAVYARWIEDQPVVAGFRSEEAARAAGIEIGDVILEIDEEDALERSHRYAKYRAASTPQALMARAVDEMLFGPDGSVANLKLRGKEGQIKTAAVARSSSYRQGFTYRSGEVIRLLEENIGYVDLDRLQVSEVEELFERFKDTEAIIFDMRGYPNGTAWAIAPYLAKEAEAPAAQFYRYLLLGPSEEGRQKYAFTQRIPPAGSHVQRYAGRTVMLIDERTVSQAEHTGLFLEAANGTVFIGSPTNGANGDITNFTVPGGIFLGFSGHSVRHADGRQLQRLGLVPYVEAKPTVEGIRAGRDEVLETATDYLRRALEADRRRQ